MKRKKIETQSQALKSYNRQYELVVKQKLHRFLSDPPPPSEEIALPDPR